MTLCVRVTTRCHPERSFFNFQQGYIEIKYLTLTSVEEEDVMMCPNLFELSMFVLERKFLKDLVPQEGNNVIARHISKCMPCARKAKAILASYEPEEDIAEVAKALKQFEVQPDVKEGVIEVQTKMTPSLA